MIDLKRRSWFLVLLMCIPSSPSCQSQVSGENGEIPLEKMIGQMILIGFNGYSVDESSPIVQDIKEGRIGGVILFDYDVVKKKYEKNIESPSQVKSLISYLKSVSPEKLFISIDQEGGRVNRLKESYGFPSSVSAQYLGELNNLDSTTFYANMTAKTLADLGFNLNFAPVVDLNINPENPAIGKVERSFSNYADLVAKHALKTIKSHHNHKVLTAIKHFPGHGSTWNDSHFGIADVTDSWKEEELEPYKMIIDSGETDLIMSAHIFNKNLDPELPATLSKSIVTDLLRNKLGYEGVIISDDMQMNAIDEHYGLETSVVNAVNAGIDILLFGNNLDNDPDIAQKINVMIAKNVAQGNISKDRIVESYHRILKLKERIQ